MSDNTSATPVQQQQQAKPKLENIAAAALAQSRQAATGAATNTTTAALAAYTNPVTDAIANLSPEVKQSAISFAAGLVAGKLSKVIGKQVISITASGFIAIQVLHKMGWISFNTAKIQKDLEAAKEQVEKVNSVTVLEKTLMLFKEHLPAVLAMGAGTLFGIAFL